MTKKIVDARHAKVKDLDDLRARYDEKSGQVSIDGWVIQRDQWTDLYSGIGLEHPKHDPSRSVWWPLMFAGSIYGVLYSLPGKLPTSQYEGYGGPVWLGTFALLAMWTGIETVAPWFWSPDDSVNEYNYFLTKDDQSEVTTN